VIVIIQPNQIKQPRFASKHWTQNRPCLTPMEIRIPS